MSNRLRSLRVKRPLLVIAACLALFAGVGLARYRVLTEGRWIFPVLLAFLYCVRRQSMPTLACIVVLFFGLGWWRGTQMAIAIAPYHEFTKKNVTITARSAEDGVYGEKSQMVFTVDHVRITDSRPVNVPGNMAIAGFGAPAVYRGDELRISGKLYPRRGNVQAGISFAQLQVLSRGNSPIDTLRRKFAAGMQSALPEPLASFGMGLLIGQRSTLPKDVADILVTVGLTHIIAVSGYNLTIIVEAARRLFGDRSKYQMLVVCLTLISTFLLLTGSSPSIVRASIISMLSIFSWYYGRKIKPMVLLLVAAAITIAGNPLYLWGNVSWYLSFLAFFGVVVIAPLVVERVYGEREPKLIAKMLLESLCAEIMTLPYALYIFGQLSLVSLPANLLIAAFVPLAMLLCMVAGLAGMWLPAIAGWFAWPARLVLRYMLDVADLLSRTPHALVEHIGFSFGQLLFWYGIVAVWLGLGLYKRRLKHGILTDKIAQK
ncbi:MAG TPA: ComEC/Rec2 family competence protein [Candidatus Saccharimonadales bacterium]|nr:ComEC/Rec2 family competence protein [Candidatus Saccharimonadales bacterium]